MSSPPNYMDGVPVKISEKFKPPPIITIPQGIINRLNSGYPPGCFDYDFTLERNVIQKIDEWRRVRQQEVEERQDRLRKQEIQRAKELGEKEKEMLTAVSYPSAEDLSSSSEDDEGTESPEDTTTSSGVTAKENGAVGGIISSENQHQQNQVVSTFGTILKPTVVPESQIKFYNNPLSIENYNLNSTTFSSNKINYSDFENDTSSPFDNCELKTMNDLDILAQVLNVQKIHSIQSSTKINPKNFNENYQEVIENSSCRSSTESKIVPVETHLSDSTNYPSPINTQNYVQGLASQISSPPDEILNKNLIINKGGYDSSPTITRITSPICYGQNQTILNPVPIRWTPIDSSNNQIVHHSIGQSYNYYSQPNQQQQQLQNYANMNGGLNRNPDYYQFSNHQLTNQNFLPATTTNLNYYQSAAGGANFFNPTPNFNYQQQFNYNNKWQSPQHSLMAASEPSDDDKNSIKSKSKSVPDILKELKDEIRDSELRRARNHSQTLEDYVEKVNITPIQNNTENKCKPESFIKLSPSSQLLVENISSMGFPLERVSKIAEKLGNDDKKIVEHLIPLSELLDLGFDENKISDALLKFNNNKEKALDFLIS